jgi:hypothetical protein
MRLLKIKAALLFLHLRIIEKIALGKNIINGITAQAAKLPNLPHTAAQLATANTDLDTKNQAASSGDHGAIAAKIASEKTWNGLFKDTASYVSYVANGDKMLIENCGFTPTSGESADALPPEAVNNFVSGPIPRNAGVLELSCDAQPKTHSNFVFAVTPANATVARQGNALVITSASGENFYIVPDTHHHILIDSLPSGTTLNTYAAAFNSVGTGPVSDVIQTRAL